MPRLPAVGVRIDAPRRDEAELKLVICNLCLTQPFADAEIHKVYSRLGEMIGQWSAEQQRLEISKVEIALASIAENLNEVSRLLAGLETGLRSDVETAVASRVADLLSMDPTVSPQSGQELLISFRSDADRIAHVCLVAIADLPKVPSKRGRRPHEWYDPFTSLLLQIRLASNQP